jgi:hypothetical protein
MTEQFTCQEASAASTTTYIPCGRPATASIASAQDNRSYNMCGFCAAHSIANRGMTEDGPPTAANPDIEVDPTATAQTTGSALEPVYDYSGFGEEAPKVEGDLATLSNLAEQGRYHNDEVERLQRELKLAQERLKDVVEFKIPELMDKVGMERFSTKNGLNIAIRESIRASMGSGVQKEKNLDWLEAQGHEAVIKMGVEIPFGKSEEDRAAAKALASSLREQNLPASFVRKVEPSTLSALMRELLEEGRPVPEEQFSLFRQRVAKITV